MHSELFETPWTVAHQAPLSIALPRQEHWRSLLVPIPEDLPDSRIKPTFPARADRFFTTKPTGCYILHGIMEVAVNTENLLKE